VLWTLFAQMMLASLLIFRAVRRNVGLLAAHLGMALILAGAMWGSAAAHHLRPALGLTPKVHKGYLIVPQGRSANEMVDATGVTQLGRLPFDVHLERFWIEHYPVDPAERWPIMLGVIEPHSEQRLPQWDLSLVDWAVGKPVDLPAAGIRLRVVEHSLTRIGQIAQAPTVPVVKMELTRGDRTVTQALAGGLPGVPARLPLAGVFASASEWFKAGSPTLFMDRPAPAVKDYKSALVVIENGKEVARKTIEVNHPLHYGGYHFYQYDYDQDRVNYTVLAVVSDSGWPAVAAGFVLVGAGIAWHAAQTIIRARRRRPGQ
jgi:hypothetical protein